MKKYDPNNPPEPKRCDQTAQKRQVYELAMGNNLREGSDERCLGASKPYYIYVDGKLKWNKAADRLVYEWAIKKGLSKEPPVRRLRLIDVKTYEELKTDQPARWYGRNSWYYNNRAIELRLNK
ncbi:hypothetical protein AGMMS50268_27750 [Spirochaetia bacterium]|nr:hypothetical protein AGMMS50268_27750 [Spirochaetia bacterium]